MDAQLELDFELEGGIWHVSDARSRWVVWRLGALPMTPRIIGLSVNAVSWAAVWWAILAIVSCMMGLIRRRRLRSGRCPWCRYPVRQESTKCSECGRGRRVSLVPNCSWRLLVILIAVHGLVLLAIGARGMARKPLVSPIHLAAHSGDLGALAGELRDGVDVDLESAVHGMTPLMFASRRGHVEAVEFLLRSGAKTSAAGFGVVKYAIDSGSTQMVERLTRYGVSWDSPAAPGLSAMDYAAQGGDLAIVATLLSQSSGHVTTEAMFWASVRCDVEVLRFLIDAGGDVDAPEPRLGHSPLITAVIQGRADAVRLLISAGADVSQQDPNGFTALTYARHKASLIDEPQSAAIEALLEQAALAARDGTE